MGQKCETSLKKKKTKRKKKNWGMAQMVEHLPGNLSSIPDNHQKQKKRRSKSRNDRYQNRDAIPSGMGDTLEGDTYTL
jgi:hypothetical protein